MYSVSADEKSEVVEESEEPEEIWACYDFQPRQFLPSIV